MGIFWVLIFSVLFPVGLFFWGGAGGRESPGSVRRTSTYRPYPTPNRTPLIFPAKPRLLRPPRLSEPCLHSTAKSLVDLKPEKQSFQNNCFYSFSVIFNWFGVIFDLKLGLLAKNDFGCSALDLKRRLGVEFPGARFFFLPNTRTKGLIKQCLFPEEISVS